MMRRCLLALVLMVATGVLRAEPVLWDAPTRDAWWAAHPDPSAWRRTAVNKLAELAQDYQPSVNNELPPGLAGWFNHLRWISLLTPAEFAETGLSLEEYRALGENEVLAKTFLNSRNVRDKTVEAMKILGQIYRAHPEDLAAYPNLAVAYALVFDVPFPDNWPHHQVAKIEWAEKSGSPAERFAYYVALDKQKKLEFSPADLSFTELKFLVDSLTSREELDWARNEVRTSLGGFDRVFNSIRYDRHRLLNRNYHWPAGLPYTLALIQEKGGICVDQAYFGVTVGKARGIPTLYFSGQGSSGGHAWYGYLKRNRSWNLDVGRYENQNYPIGEARDPQTWMAVNDQELLQFTDTVLKNPRFAAAEMLFFWAQANRKEAFYKATLDQVRTMVPEWVAVWQEEAHWMASTSQPIEVQKEFYRQWSSQFTKFPDLRIDGQARLLDALTKAGDTEGASKVRDEVVRQNRRKRFDIGIGAAGGAIFELVEKKDWDGAEKEYKKIVRQFDAQGGGNLFYGVVQPFVLTLLEEGQNKIAENALEFASKKMPQGEGSILLGEFEELQGKIRSAKAAGK